MIFSLGPEEGEVMELINQLTLLRKQSSFNLRKLISNVSGISRNISKGCRESTDSLFLNNDNGIKMLVIHWNLKADFFFFLLL